MVVGNPKIGMVQRALATKLAVPKKKNNLVAIGAPIIFLKQALSGKIMIMSYRHIEC